MRYIFSIFMSCFLLHSNVTAQALTDGEYLIKVNQTGKYFAIAGANKDNGTWLIQWDNEYKQHFIFIITHLGNGVYTLKAKHSGKYLSTEGTPQRGAKLIQWDWKNQDNQKWYITKRKGTNGYSISCFQNNMNVTLQYWGAATVQSGNGAYAYLTNDISVAQPVFDFKKNETGQTESNSLKSEKISAASFKKAGMEGAVKMLTPVEDGIYKIRINETGKYLAIAGQEDMNNGMKLIQWDMLPRNNHLFAVQKLQNGTYSIKPVHSEKELDVADMRQEDGTQVQQWESTNTPNQQWQFYTGTNGVHIVSKASGKKLQLSAGATNSNNGVPLIITSNATQTFSLYPAKAQKFTEYITLKNVRFTVPHGGDLDMYGAIQVYLIDKHGNSYNRYYESAYNQDVDADNILFYRSENQPIDMDKHRLVDLGGAVKFKISSEELVGAKIMVVYGINEDDADVAPLFRDYGVASGPQKEPNKVRPIDKPYKGGGSDDFYGLKNSFTNCVKSNVDGYATQYFSVSDIPSNCLVHVNLQDEDGSNNWLDIYFTITKERKL